MIKTIFELNDKEVCRFDGKLSEDETRKIEEILAYRNNVDINDICVFIES